MLKNQTSKIKNIIFDLGGVILNINPLLSLLELETISQISKEVLVERMAKEKIFENFDTGSLTPAQFRSSLRQIINLETDDSEIDRIWNKMLLDFPFQRIELLQQLRKNYHVFLLSNTNFIHFNHFSREFIKKYNFPLTDLFDRVFVSYEIGIHKPDAGIYTHVIEKAEIDASETLFIDDSLANIQAAASLGISGIHIKDFDVTEYFESAILKNREDFLWSDPGKKS
jgi:glucose-1-phosphatase